MVLVRPVDCICIMQAGWLEILLKRKVYSIDYYRVSVSPGCMWGTYD